jgi:DNA-binding transcriptional MerR regulator
MTRQFSMKETAEMIAEAGGFKAIEIHTALRSWRQTGVITPAKSGDATSPLVFSETDVVRLFLIFFIRRDFPISGESLKELLELNAWAAFEPKSQTLPDGTQLSYSLKGAIHGIKEGTAWNARVERGDSNGWRVQYHPARKNPALGSPEKYMVVELNKVLPRILKVLKALPK